MSIEDYPLNARTGMLITMTDTYVELITLMRTNDAQAVMIIGRMLELAPIERDGLLSFLQERQLMLEKRLRDQLRMLFVYQKQEAGIAKERTSD